MPAQNCARDGFRHYTISRSLSYSVWLEDTLPQKLGPSGNRLTVSRAPCYDFLRP